MLSSPFQNSPIDRLESFYKFHTTADVLRLDQLHPVVSGNKWFKLQHYLQQAGAEGKRIILTYGGAYSNHIVATAAATRERGLQSIGVIRGERPRELSPTLLEAQSYGMQFHFVTREAYRDKALPQELLQSHDLKDLFLIPEGGYGLPGALGAATILSGHETNSYTHILAACGTGTTLAGLIRAARDGQQVIGIPVLRNYYSLEAEIKILLPPQHTPFTLLHDHHQGGYAKHNPELIRFMNWWYEQTGIPSDFVYTGKLFYAAHLLAEQGYFPQGSRLLLIHSGGLQGNRSLPKGTLIF